MTDAVTALVQRQLTKLYTKPQDSQPSDDFDLLVATTFTPDVKIVFNHESITLDQYKDNLTLELGAVRMSEVQWQDSVDLPAEGDQIPQVGIVAGSFIVVRTMKFLIGGAPAQMLEHNFFSVKVILAVPRDNETEAANFVDNRRISEFFLTSVNKPAPIRLQATA